jgi:DUF1680 family protein
MISGTTLPLPAGAAQRIRNWLAAGCAALAISPAANAAEGGPPGANLAVVATASTSFVSGHETITALNNGTTPANSNDKSHGAYGNWPRTGTQWVQYDWSQPITTRQMDVYWFDDGGGVRAPKACRLKYWDGASFLTLTNASGLGLQRNRFNTTTFPDITTTKLRLELDSDGSASTGILEWRVYDTGASPNFAPSVVAGVDRVVAQPGQTYLGGNVKDDGKPNPVPIPLWSKQSGPGSVTFGDAGAGITTARFSQPGAYVLKLSADDGQLSASDTLHVTVNPAPAAMHLDPVWTTSYQITSPFWHSRVKSLIVNWIPYCASKIEDPKLPEGGIENFIEAGNKLAGRPFTNHVGAPFANAWVYNTLQSMCLALEVDPQGDQEILQAQAAMRKTIGDWVSIILGAQEPDGYLHTQYTIQGHRRWTNKADHEGYQAGYFMEAAMAHFQMTGGKDARMLDAAKRLADCWCNNIGPAPKRPWYEGHEELEQALVQLARFIEDKEGAGKGRRYVELAKFLLDSRKNGEDYDQSRLPVTRQYEAVGHAVRAVYCYSGMADIGMETGDMDYYSAVESLWDNLVNRKYYITGGVGSGETSEGFGKDYSLPNNSYCESCASCGEVFFQHKMQMACQDARYADLYEETLYNALLGSVDLDGRNYTYANPLDSRQPRYLWHVCPCCVGNIPRTLLMLPEWIYSKGADSLYVNLFIGSSVTVDHFAGTSVQMVQATEYPWSGDVSITVNPAASKRFTVKIRVPNRSVSQLYTATPACDGIISMALNGSPLTPVVQNGYAAITRDWKAGDKIDLVLPMKIQRVKASRQVAADAGRVALRYGPLIYNLESVDQNVDAILAPSPALSTEWNGRLLGGVMVIKGAFADGTPMMAIPNYARLNRGGRSIVWVKDQ